MPRRKKGKSRDAKGPQLPRYVQEQLAVREERDDVASGFENADFHFGRRRSAGGDGDENEDDQEDEALSGQPPAARWLKSTKTAETAGPEAKRRLFEDVLFERQPRRRQALLAAPDL